MKRRIADRVCPNCGRKILVYELVCPQCGTELERVVPAPISLGTLDEKPKKSEADEYDLDSFDEDDKPLNVGGNFWGDAPVDIARSTLDAARMEEAVDRVGKSLRADAPKSEPRSKKERSKNKKSKRSASFPKTSASEDSSPTTMDVEFAAKEEPVSSASESSEITEKPADAEPVVLNAPLEEKKSESVEPSEICEKPINAAPFALDAPLENAASEMKKEKDERAETLARAKPVALDLPLDEEKARDKTAEPKVRALAIEEIAESDKPTPLPDFSKERPQAIEIPDENERLNRKIDSSEPVKLPNSLNARSYDRGVPPRSKLGLRKFARVYRSPETRVFFARLAPGAWFLAIAAMLVLCFPCGVLAFRSFWRVFERIYRYDFEGAEFQMTKTARFLKIGAWIVVGALAAFLAFLATKVDWSSIVWVER